MKARLKGKSFSDIYDISDQRVDKLAITRENVKLRRVFGSPSQLKEAFSSIKNIKIIKDELHFEGVNKPLISEYAFIKSNGQPIDEMDVYKALLFDTRWVTKSERIKKFNDLKKKELADDASSSLDDFKPLLEWYQLIHFDTLRVTKEVIQMDDGLLCLFRERKLASLFDELLRCFYGRTV